ncbi:Ig-like domain-containing protein [Gemmatimonas sp.]
MTSSGVYSVRKNRVPSWPRGLRAAITLLVAAAAACGGGGSDSPTPPTTVVTVATVSVSPPAGQILPGATIALSATARDAAGNAVAGRATIWSSSSSTVATVDGNGIVTGVAAGTTTVQATVSGVSGSATITVAPVPVASVAVTPFTSSVVVGSTTPLAAIARDAAGNTLTGRTVTWTSASTGIATVTSSGVVTGVAPGAAVISATVDGTVGTATVTVTAPPAATLDVVEGAAQQGLLNRPLADSLVVRVRATNGSGVAGVAVSWATANGTVSATNGVTDAQGVARVQFTPSAASASATATVAGLTPVTFNATARAGGACTLAPSNTTRRFSLGPTDFTLSLRAANPIRAAVLFVDYPGLPATETPAQLMSSVMDPGAALMREMSYGRLNLTTVAFPQWYRMPQPLSSYDWSTYNGHRQFLLDVLSVTNAAIDFSSFDALYVFSPPSANKPVSPTFNGGSSANVMADGRNFGNAVTFGTDVRTYGPSIMAHETGHMLGLVDLYAFFPAGGTNYAGNQFKFIGAWSMMSNVFNAAHFLTWEKRKLGWIDETQVDCLPQAAGVEAVLTPNQVTGGRKMVVVPIDTSSALVVEVRNNVALDANLCTAGVLLYQVDARTPSGEGPVQLLGSRASTAGTAFTKCGPWADGTFGSGSAPISTYTHPPSGATVTVLRAEADGSYRVRVKR